MVVRSSGRFDVGSARIRICPKVSKCFAVQVTSTRFSWWATFVVIASLGVGVGSLLRGVSLWLPLGVEAVGFVLWVVVKSLELRHLKIAQMAETTATAMVTMISARSVSDPGASEGAQSAVREVFSQEFDSAMKDYKAATEQARKAWDRAIRALDARMRSVDDKYGFLAPDERGES